MQAASDLSERELSTVARLTGVRVTLASALQYEQVSFNQAAVDPSVGGPPPWAGDPAVLQALDLALDRPGLEGGPLHNRSPLAGSPVSPLLGWAYASDVGATPYNLEQARRVLDADGWSLGADGIRTKNGRRLAFALTSTQDQLLRTNEEEILAAGWRKLGIDVSAQNYSSQQLFADFAHGRRALARPLPGGDLGLDHSAGSGQRVRHAALLPDACGRPLLGPELFPLPRRRVDQSLSAGSGDAGRGAARRRLPRLPARLRRRALRAAALPPAGDRRHLARGCTTSSSTPGPAGSSWNMADWWLTAEPGSGPTLRDAACTTR